MFAGIAAVIIAVMFMKKGKWDKASIALLLLGGGVLAKAWGNPVVGFSGNITKIVALAMVVWIVLDFVTKRIEKVTYPVAFFAPFFALACGGIIGKIANTIFSMPILTQAFSQLT